jgi:hypothetical protein
MFYFQTLSDLIIINSKFNDLNLNNLQLKLPLILTRDIENQFIIFNCSFYNILSYGLLNIQNN